MRRVVPLTCVFLLFISTTSFAQQRLFAHTQREVVEVDPRAASLGTVIRRFPLPAAAQGPVFGDVFPFGGGAFLAYTNTTGLAVLDTRSGAVQHFVLPGFQSLRMVGSDGNARLLVSGLNADFHHVLVVADVRSAEVRLIDLGMFPTVAGLAYASGPNVLFASRCDAGECGFKRVVEVLDVATGNVLKTFEVEPSPGQGLSSNAAGTQLFVQNLFRGTLVYDVVSGTEIARSTADELARGVPIVDDVRGRLLVLAPDSRRLTAFAMDSLQPLGSVTLPGLPSPGNSTLHHVLDVSDQSATIFAVQGLVRFASQNGTDPGGCSESQLLALDVATGAVRTAANTTATFGAAACNNLLELVRVTEPAPPRGLRADVAGHQVTLEWQAPFGATDYDIEAGLAPGLTNATVRSTDARLVVNGVPSGTYYLRVRAINTIATSGASQEIQVVIP